MSFTGPYQYGTPGGTEDTTVPTIPQIVRVFQGRALIGFLVVNTTMQSKLRAEVEQVTRILDQVTAALGPVQINSNGLLVDTDLREITFDDALGLIADSPGYVSVYIPASSLTNVMLIDLLASSRTIGNFTLQSSDFANLAVGTAEILNANVTSAKLDRAYLTSFPAGFATLESSVESVNVLYGPGVSTLSLGVIVLPNNGVTYDVQGFATFIPSDVNLQYAFAIGITGSLSYPPQTTPFTALATFYNQLTLANQSNVSVTYSLRVNNVSASSFQASSMSHLIAIPQRR
jgi:hypothetical protein